MGTSIIRGSEAGQRKISSINCQWSHHCFAGIKASLRSQDRNLDGNHHVKATVAVTTNKGRGVVISSSHEVWDLQPQIDRAAKSGVEAPIRLSWNPGLASGRSDFKT
jgi:hypothetical protein